MPTPAPAMPPLPQDVEQFLTWMTDQKGFSPATISAYRTDLLQFEEWLHREQHSLARPGELEKYHFQDYSAHLFHEGQARSSIGRQAFGPALAVPVSHEDEENRQEPGKARA